MIRRLVIKGFQRHKKLELRLDAGVTTIVGPTNRGKSSILRALRWVLLNEAPKGRIVHWDRKRATVTVSVDRRSVKRTRGVRGQNYYYLDGDKHTAFGKEVPQDVAQVFNVSPLNFQGQHERAFWFSLSPAEVSRQLNAIVDLGAIDSTLAALASMVRENRTEQRVTRSRLEEAEEQAQELRPVLKAHKALEIVEELEREAGAKRLRAANLRTLLDRAEEHQEAARMLRASKGAALALERLERSADALRATQERSERLGEWVQALCSAQRECADLKESWAEEHEKLDALLGEECPVCGRS